MSGVKPEDILKRVERLNEDAHEVEKEHSLQENAKERAHNPLHINAGTAFDWEEVDAYARELERLDREGPGLAKKTDKAP